MAQKTVIKVMLEYYSGEWCATASDECGEFCKARDRSRIEVKKKIQRKIDSYTVPAEGYEIEWLDISASAADTGE